MYVCFFILVYPEYFQLNQIRNKYPSLWAYVEGDMVNFYDCLILFFIIYPVICVCISLDVLNTCVKIIL